MIKINSPISILEFSSTHIYLNVYDKAIMSQNSFYEEKIKGLKEVLCWGTGTPKREFLFVDDLAEAVIFVL